MHYWKKLANSTYAQLMEHLEAEAGLPSSGAISKSEVKSEVYYQHRISFMGERVVFYAGKECPEMKERLRQRNRLCSTLVVNGCNMPDRDSASTLELLDAAGCFANQRAILVGSHALGVIGNMLGVTWQSDIVETVDVDLGRFVKLSGAKTIDLKDVLTRAGFRSIPQLSHKHPPTSFVHPRGVKVDFLTPMLGKGNSKPVQLSGMGIYADGLRFLDYLITDPVQGAVITRNGILVQVPQPARYAFHKCIVATRRMAAMEAKRKKDIQQAAALFKVLLELRSGDIREAWAALQWRDQALKGIAMLDVGLREELEEVIAQN